MQPSDIPELPSWEYWLNSRPPRDLVVTRANAADGYPNPLTPLTQDLVITCENWGAHHFFSTMLGAVEADARAEPFMLAFYGYITINVELIGGMGAALPGTTQRRLLEQYFGFNPDPEKPEPGPVPSKLRTVRDGIGVGARMVRAYRDFAPRIDRVRAAVEAARPASAATAQGPGDEELAAWLERLFEVASEAWVLPMIGGSLAASGLDAVRGQLGGSEAERTDLCNRLHTGIGGNESAEAGLAPRRLAAIARAEGVADALASASPAEFASISPRFATEFTTAIERFGYRGISELELSRPSWRQDPGQLLEAVRREVSVPEAAGPGTDGIRADAEREARERLGAVRYAALSRTLRISRKILSLRENCKIPVVAAHDEVRRALELAAPRLIERGALPDAEAAPYLLGEELAGALRGKEGPSEEEIAVRRRTYQACWDVAVPELMRVGTDGRLGRVENDFYLDLHMFPPTDSGGGEDGVGPGGALSGIGAAPGRVTAVARVIDDPLGPQGDEFAPGDVLVASTVDPGWSPLLAVAGAVVLDIGGELSHGAMVARELGVPCVVNVKHGTTTLQSGSEVEVDGSIGTVTPV